MATSLRHENDRVAGRLVRLMFRHTLSQYFSTSETLFLEHSLNVPLKFLQELYLEFERSFLLGIYMYLCLPLNFMIHIPNKNILKKIKFYIQFYTCIYLSMKVFCHYKRLENAVLPLEFFTLSALVHSLFFRPLI